MGEFRCVCGRMKCRITKDPKDCDHSSAVWATSMETDSTWNCHECGAHGLVEKGREVHA